MTGYAYLDDVTDPRCVELIDRGNAEVRRRLHDGTLAEDIVRVRAILEDEDKLFFCRLRDGRLYDFHRGPDHPRGLWRRLPGDAAPAPDADWEPVFDVDAYCEATGHEWAWRGPVDGPDPARVMIVFSDNGSDMMTAWKRCFAGTTRSWASSHPCGSLPSPKPTV